MIKYHNDLIQGSDEWLAARRGILTASNMKHIVKKKTDKKTGDVTYSAPDDDKCRAYLYELLAQRVNQYTEPEYIGDDMLRGQEDEVEARILYNANYAPLETMGFATNDEWGFTIGCSPDDLVGDDGFIEAKSRRQKFQMETLIECVANNTMPDEYVLQVQTGFLVMKRKWCDFISYSGGMMMATVRVYPDPIIMAAIVDAARSFEKKMEEKLAIYHAVLKSNARLIPTKRRVIEEIVV